MFEGEFTHRGDRCTFEVLLGHAGLDDPALAAIGEIIHDIDLKDGKYGREEAAGVAQPDRRHRRVERRRRAAPGARRRLLDDLYRFLRRQEGQQMNSGR